MGQGYVERECVWVYGRETYYTIPKNSDVGDPRKPM